MGVKIRTSFQSFAIIFGGNIGLRCFGVKGHIRIQLFGVVLFGIICIVWGHVVWDNIVWGHAV